MIELQFNKQIMSDFNFIKFQGMHGRTEDRITITKSESIGFPTKFYKDNGIDNFKYVVLFYDSEKKAVGVHFTNSEEEKNKFTIIKSKQGYGGSIIARSFFRGLGIEANKYRNRYKWSKSNIDGIGEIYVINLLLREENK